jgi:hypothetical protein
MWNHSDGFKEDTSAFIFSVDNKTKFYANANCKKYAIYCDSGNGPQFGNDIQINYNCNT